jgi:protein-disulfide isomerase
MTLSRRALTLALGSAALAGWPAVGSAAVSAQDRTLGNPKAKVTVYEYASVTCPHCGRWNQDVWPAFKRKYVDTGLVLFVLRELPTEPAVVATGGFLVARCANPANYFTVIDALFAGQQELFQSGDFQGWLVQAGAAGGLSRERVLACAQDEDAMAALNARIDASLRQHRVGVTPTFIINDVTLQGEQSLAQLDAVIQPMLRGQR